MYASLEKWVWNFNLKTVRVWLCRISRGRLIQRKGPKCAITKWLIIKSFVNKKQELNLDAINHRKRGYFEQGRGNNYGLDRPTVNIAAAFSTFWRRSDWYLGTKRIGEVEVRGDECMDKSFGGLRTDEFPYFQNPVQPMECFTADLANMDGHRYRSVKPGAQIENTFQRLDSGVESPTVMESIEILGNWWREPRIKK